MCLMSVMKRTKDETKVILTEDDFSQKVHCEKSEKFSTAFFSFSFNVKTQKIFLTQKKNSVISWFAIKSVDFTEFFQKHRFHEKSEKKILNLNLQPFPISRKNLIYTMWCPLYKLSMHCQFFPKTFF